MTQLKSKAEKFAKYLAKGIVGPNDRLVIAVTGDKIWEPTKRIARLS